jgi:hypothetical protein
MEVLWPMSNSCLSTIWFYVLWTSILKYRCYLIPPSSYQENKCKVLEIISKDIEGNRCEMMVLVCLHMLTGVATWNTRIQPPKSILMIIGLFKLMLRTMKMLSSYLLKKKPWISLKHLSTWIHQRSTRKNLAMLQEVKIRKGPQILIAS